MKCVGCGAVRVNDTEPVPVVTATSSNETCIGDCSAVHSILPMRRRTAQLHEVKPAIQVKVRTGLSGDEGDTCQHREKNTMRCSGMSTTPGSTARWSTTDFGAGSVSWEAAPSCRLGQSIQPPNNLSGVTAQGAREGPALTVDEPGDGHYDGLLWKVGSERRGCGRSLQRNARRE